jgi:hypothetical protein
VQQRPTIEAKRIRYVEYQETFGFHYTPNISKCGWQIFYMSDYVIAKDNIECMVGKWRSA